MIENELIDRIRNGSLEAFTEFYNTHINLIYHTIHAFRRKYKAQFTQEDIEDIAQKTLLKLWKGALQNFDPDIANISTYLRVIVWSVCLDCLKSSDYRWWHQRTISFQAPISDTEEDDMAITWEDTFQSTSNNQLTDAIRKEAENLAKVIVKEIPPGTPLEKKLENALLEVGLTKRERLALRLYYAGLKYREIAELMGISIDTVGSMLHRARKKCRRAFERICIKQFHDLWEDGEKEPTIYRAVIPSED